MLLNNYKSYYRYICLLQLEDKRCPRTEFLAYPAVDFISSVDLAINVNYASCFLFSIVVFMLSTYRAKA